MMKNFMTLYRGAHKVVTRDRKTWNDILKEHGDLIYNITCMKFQVGFLTVQNK